MFLSNNLGQEYTLSTAESQFELYLDKPRHSLVSQDGPSEVQFVERRKYPGKLLPSLVVNSVPGVLIN